MGDPEFLVPVYGWLYPETLARAMAGIIALILLIVIARSTRSFERAAFAGIAVLLLLSPTLHPWYLLWVVPFLAFVDSPAWLWLSLSIPLAYMGSNGFGGVQSGGSLTPPASTSWTLPGSGVPVWVSAVEYLPMILLRLTVRKAR